MRLVALRAVVVLLALAAGGCGGARCIANRPLPCGCSRFALAPMPAIPMLVTCC